MQYLPTNKKMTKIKKAEIDLKKHTLEDLNTIEIDPLEEISCFNLKVEYQKNPLGIDVKQPRFSWQIKSFRRGTKQLGYRIQVATSQEFLLTKKNILWDSAEVYCDKSIHISYIGTAPLLSEKRYYWRVLIIDETGNKTAWSKISWWEMGLLGVQDWQANWIEPIEKKTKEGFKPAPYLRRDFLVEKKVTWARIYATAHGVYELSMNGKRISDQLFAPGYTSYESRLQYQTYDVTDQIQKGRNAIGVILADGWYRGKLIITSNKNVYGKNVGFLMQLHILYEDGTERLVVTDEKWRATTKGPIRRSDSKDGEIYDARLEMPGWNVAQFDDADWEKIQIKKDTLSNLIASSTFPVRRKEEFKPVEIKKIKEKFLVDFGQNIAGNLRFRVAGSAGKVIIFKHGESLDLKGNLSLDHLQPTMPGVEKLLQEVQYILKGDGLEIYEPRFTVHGFRYVEITGWPKEEILADELTATAIYSDLEKTGTFECSNEKINHLQKNIEWSMKGNFLDIPTDCPTRERTGWTGDAQIFSRTASFLVDTTSFFEKWLSDFTIDQRKNGLIPNAIPDVGKMQSPKLMNLMEGSSGWGDAVIIIPWTLYQVYGDIRVLEKQYESMLKWIEFALKQSRRKDLTDRINPLRYFRPLLFCHEEYDWNKGYHWGDWLAPLSWEYIPLTITKNILTNRKAESIIATAYLANSTYLFSKISSILGKIDEKKHYTKIHKKIKLAFAEKYICRGRLDPHSQTSYVLALMFDLLPESFRPLAIANLIELIRLNKDHLSTGFLSTPFICHVLSRYGNSDLAYELLNQNSYPSWLYAVEKGATTIWENWDAINEKGHVKGSLNHFVFGSIGAWLYQVVAGIELDPKNPGYKHFFIQPLPGGELTYAKAIYQSSCGEIISAWKIENGEMFLHVKIPANTSATVKLPQAQIHEVFEGEEALSKMVNIENIKQLPASVAFLLGSGEYNFKWKLGSVKK